MKNAKQPVKTGSRISQAMGLRMTLKEMLNEADPEKKAEPAAGTPTEGEPKNIEGEAETVVPGEDHMADFQKNLEITNSKDYEKNTNMRRILFIKRIQDAPPVGIEVVCILRNGQFEIARFDKERDGYFNRRNLRVFPRFWHEFVLPPASVRGADPGMETDTGSGGAISK